MESREQMPSHRVQWIDYAKVLALYLMVVGHHVSQLNENMSMWIYSFHMPLFFFFAGVLYKPRSPREMVKKDFVALIIPFLLLNAICLIWTLLKMCLYDHMPLPNIMSLTKIVGLSLIGSGVGLSTSVKPVCVYMWFFIALLYIHLIASLGYKALKPTLIIMSIVGIIAAILLSGYVIYTPIASALMAMPFFAIGYLLKAAVRKDYPILLVVIALVVSACAHFVFFQLNGRADINKVIFGNSVALYYLIASLGIVMAAALGMLLSKVSGKRLRSAITDLSVGAMVVVGLQDMALFGSVKTVVEASKVGLDTDVIIFVSSLVIMAVFVVIIRLCRHYFPIILGGR